MATPEVPIPSAQAPERPAMASGLERPASEPAANAGPAGRAGEVSGSDAATLCRRTWWVFLLGGIASLAFGVLAIARPEVALLVLALFFAAAVLVDGVANVVGGLLHRQKDGWWIVLAIGLLGVLVGAYALLNPPVGVAAFVLLVAFQAVALGVFLLLLGWRVRQRTQREWLLYLTGALSIAFGVLIAADPVAGSRSIVYFVAGWAIATGVFRIAFALRARRAGGDEGTGGEARAAA
ncbi:MAG: HdeD family acid-resistance protein [Steroidobacteraceae bacterium]|jgi:uncharacterized membrane protein HdeD (DUF308 family)|nr:HdeD family acid-resistance protein [Steroidobacteraceae bacterium]